MSTMGEAPVIDLDDPVVVLDGFPALVGGRMIVRSGQLVVVTGPNGSGKSTLLRLLAGLVPLAAGRATVLGCDLATGRRSHRREVGYLGHVASLYRDLTVRDNLAFRLALDGIRDVPAALVEGFGLDDLVDVAASRLSAGQRQRLALASVVGRRPSLLLLDEPHATLDVHWRERLEVELADFTNRGGTAVVVTHDLGLHAHVNMRADVRGGSINSIS